MNVRKVISLLAGGLLVTLLLYVVWETLSPEEPGEDQRTLAVDEVSGRDMVAPDETAGSKTLVGTVDQESTSEPVTAGGASERDIALSNRTARELLLGEATVLETLDVRVGRSNRVVRRTLYKTEFKYPHVLKRETIDIAEDGIETLVREELMVGDHVMVKLPDGLDENLFAEWAGDNGLEIRHRLKTAPIVLLSAADPGPATVEQLEESVDQYFVEIGEDPEIQIAEPDYIYFPTATPNDPFYSDLWGLHNVAQTGGTNDADIDAPEAWDLARDSSSVLVAVIDTGVDRDHPDLNANMWTNPLEIAGNGVDDDNNGFVDDVHGWDFVDNDNDPDDGGSHGTHCAGTIGAVGNNGQGIVGVSWEASMVGIRFLGPFGGSTSDAIESVNYATTIGVDLTSNSWGGGGFSSLLLEAIEDGGSEGILFVAAAGNESVDNDINPHYPSSYNVDDIISVAASDDNDEVATFSNWGRNSVDLAAPGVLTYSTVPNGNYGYKSGTSMATPHVSGAVALLRAIAPQLPHLDLKEQLLETVDPAPDFNLLTRTGGRLNLHSAMLAVGGPSILVTGFSVSDISGGDGNGIINPGETVDLQIEVTNQGTQTATGATARLIKGPGSVFSGGTNTVPLGSILSGQSVSVPAAFQITASSQAPTPVVEDLTIRLTWGASGQFSRDLSIPLTVATSSIISGRVTAVGGGFGIGGATISYTGPVSGSVTADSSGFYQVSVIDGDYTISASANGFATSATQAVTTPPDQSGVDFVLGRPDLQISPSTFSFDLFSGQVVTEPFTLTNNGNSPLNWSLSTSQGLGGASGWQELPGHTVAGGDPDAPADAGKLQIPAIFTPASDLVGVRIGLITTWVYSIFEDDLVQRGAIINSALTFPLSANQLDDYDVLLVDDEISSANAQDIVQLRDWIESGGGLLMMGDNSDSIANMNSVLDGSGIQEVSRGSFGTFTITNIEPHPTTEDVGSVFSNQAGTYLTVSDEADVLMREPDGAAHAAAGSLGSGSIVAVGNEIASSSNFSSGDTRLFANQVVGWLNDKFGWLSVSPEDGSLPPGASVTVDLTVDTAGLVTGYYTQSVIVDSNDPLKPQLVVPVALSVTGSPLLSFVGSEFVFNDTVIGQSTVGNITLQNVGTDVLTINSLSTSSSRFSVLERPPITIEAGEELGIKVRFSPVSSALVGGNLLVGSDDPSNSNAVFPISGLGYVAPSIGGRVTRLSGGSGIQNATISYSGPRDGSVTTNSSGNYSFSGPAGTYTVTVSAAGFSPSTLTATIPPSTLDLDFVLGAPELSVDPGSVDVTLYSGDSASETVMLENLGDVPVNWTSAFSQFNSQLPTQLSRIVSLDSDPDVISNNNAERIIPSLETTMSLLNGVRVGLISNTGYSTIMGDLAQRGAVLSLSLSFPISEIDLESLDVLIIDDAIVSATTADVNRVREFVQDGGGLLLMGDNSGLSMSQNNAILSGSGIQTISRGSFGAFTMTDIAEHPTTEDVVSVFGSGVGAYCSVAGDAEYLVRSDDGRAHAAASTLGSGRVIAAGDEIMLDVNFSSGDGRLFSNQVVDWLSSTSDLGWITVTPNSGSVPVGEERDVLLEFDSSGLSSGTYEVDWIINSNDANSPQITVPLSLQVDGSPNLTVNPDTGLLFPDTNTGRVSSLSVSIINSGTENLTISSLNSSLSQFSALISLPFSVAPGGTVEVPVSFAPDAAGAFSGVLTIVSNDPVDGTVALDLFGNGTAAPTFSLNPGSLSLSIFEGEDISESLEIANLGTATLNWSGTVNSADTGETVYDVDWNNPPHFVNQVSATGGANAPTLVRFGNPTVRQSAGSMTDRPLEFVGSPVGTYNYSQIHFAMGSVTEKVILEFDLQKLDDDVLTVIFDAPSVFTADFRTSSISFGNSIPYDSAAVNRVRMEFDLGTRTASLSLNGATPTTRSVSSSLTNLDAIRFNVNDQGTPGGVLIDNVRISRVTNAVSNSQFSAQSDWLTLNPLSGVVTPGGSQTVDVEIESASLSAGTYPTAITFQTNDPVDPSVILPVELTVLPPPRISIIWLGETTLQHDGDAQVTFDNVITSGTTSEFLRIYNFGRGLLKDVFASIDGADANEFSVIASLGNLEPGEFIDVPVFFNPSELRQHEATLTITSSDSERSPFVISLNGQLVPDVPEIEVQVTDGNDLVNGQSSLTFPTVVGGGSSQISLTVRNTGTGYLRDLSTTFEGANADLFTAESFSNQILNPGQDVDITITYTPNSTDERTVVLQVNSNDEDEDPFEINLSGDGISAQTTLQSWATSYGLSGNSLLPTADDDGDSVSLIHEYAFNLDPTRRDSDGGLVPGTGTSGLPLIRLSGDRLEVEYIRRMTDSNLNLQILFGSDLDDNSPEGLAPSTEAETIFPIDLNWVRVIVRDSETTESSSRRFATWILDTQDP